MASLGNWLESAHPHTWANAFAPIIVGVEAVLTHAPIIRGHAMLVLVVVWVLIAGANSANDHSDGIRGIDDDRSGPLRLTGSGLVEPRVVRYAVFDAFDVAGLAGVALSMMSVWWLILVGALYTAAVWFYTGGKNPYGYHGLGEVSVFVFFGLVTMPGTEFAQTDSLSWVGLVCAVGIGSMSSTVNLVNNLYDIPTNAVTGKIMLTIRLGDFRARIAQQILSIISALVSTFIVFWRPQALVGLLIVSLWVKASESIRMHKKGKELIPVLGLTGKMMLAWSVITTLTLALS